MAASGTGTRTATVVAAGVQAAAVMAIVYVGSVSEGVQLDPWRPVAIAALYLVPVVLALLALRARPSLLLAAATTSVVLATVGFSLHSFVFLPAAVVYVVAYARAERRSARASMAPALLCPTLALGALFFMLVHADSACATRYASGEVTVDRDVGDVTSGSETMPADSDVVATECTSDTVVGWEAAGSVALSGLALGAGVVLSADR